MFIKLGAKWFGGRLTVQERGAGLGDIFTQNTLTAIKVVCQVLDLSLCGHRVEEGGGHFSLRPPHQPESWEARALFAPTHTYIYMLLNSETKVSSFLLTFHGKRYSYYRPCTGDLSPLSAYPADFLTFRSQLSVRGRPRRHTLIHTESLKY